jgi:uncharacterized protein YbjT (DUF2867 family)
MSLGMAESLVGDMVEQATLNQAVKGIEAIYHICPNMHPDEALIAERLLYAARASGVKRFVYHSVLHPQIEAMGHHWQKMRVEEKLFAAGLPYTILQPAAYMQNVLANWEQMMGQGEYTVPYSLDTRLSMVDLLDVAEVAAKVLLEDGHISATYELCGRETLSQHEIAAILSEIGGREVQGTVISLYLWQQRASSAGLSDYAVETLLDMFRYYDAHGFNGNSSVLAWLLGRSPTTFRAFLERYLDQP